MARHLAVALVLAISTSLAGTVSKSCCSWRLMWMQFFTDMPKR